MQGAPVFRGAEVPVPPEDTRLRLVVGMAAALAEKGFASTTIADVARHARASKRTFYEHFETKEDCLIACYELASEVALQTTIQAASPSLPWDARVRAATAAYLGTLEQNPSLTRTLMMDIYAAGPKGMKVRRKGLVRFADWLRGMVEQERGRYGARRLSPAMAAAVVGGINEMVLLAVEEGRAHALTELADTAFDLIQAVLGSLSARRPARSRRTGTGPRA